MGNNPFDIFADQYENWFKVNHKLFQSEVFALKQVVPTDKKGLEIGIGSRFFAEKLNIKFGIDLSESILKLALQRNLNADYGIAENLPYFVKEMISLIESSNFVVSEIFQTLTNLKRNEIERPIKGFGKGSFIVIKANKK